MTDSDQKNKESDTASIDSNVSSTVSIFCSCDRQSCRKFWCGFNSYWRLTALFFAVAFYLIFGGIIFSAVEGPSEQMRIQQAEEDRINAFNNLTDMLMSLTNLTDEEARNLTATIVVLGDIASSTIPAELNPIWDYSSAFFFSSTVITTIGYGTIAPSTAAGQIIFMFYAILGIPLALIFLAQIGSIINKFIHASLKPVRKRWGPTVSRTIGVVTIFLVTLIFFIIIPGAIFSAIESWTYLEGVYYAVVSLTTVGFGDFVPTTAGTQGGDVGTRLYKFMSTAWLWIGLSMVSALLTEMQSLLEAAGKWCRTNNWCGLAKKHIKEKVELENIRTEKEKTSGRGDTETAASRA